MIASRSPPPPDPTPAAPARATLPAPAFGATPAATAELPATSDATAPPVPATPAPAAQAPPPARLALNAIPHPTFGAPPPPPAAPVAPAAGLASNLSTPLAEAGASRATFTADDELILQIETPDGESADTLVAYGTRAGTYLPLGALARFLELGIAISDDGNYASGTVPGPQQAIAVNLRQGTIVVAGHERPLARGEAMAFEGELYLRADRFAELFPLTLTVNPRKQTVAIKPLAPFPYQQRMQREQTRERLASRTGGPAKPAWPRERTPWSALTFPLADIEVRAVSDSTLGARTETDLRLAGDVAFMTARAFVSTSSRYGLTAARLELGRQDPDANLLGPLRATEFQLGDIATAALPLALRGTAGRGASLTNAPLAQASVFDTLDFRGELPNGNEVELYRNNTLIGSTRTPVNGRYEFLQVPVDYGLNVFRLVFYGPQGQRREEIRRLTVGDGRLGQGELVYAAGAAQQDVNLFKVRLPNFLPGPDFGHWRASAQVQYGVTTSVTASAAAAWFETTTGPRELVSGGLRTGLGGMAIKLDAGYETATRAGTKSGRALELGLGGKVFGFSYALTHAEYAGAFSDEVRAFTSDPLTRATELNVNGILDLRAIERSLALPLSGRFRRIAFADGHVQTDGSLATSVPAFGAIVSSRLEYASSVIPGTQSFTGLTGAFDLATLSHSRTRYHATLDYGIAPHPRLNALSFDVDHAIDDHTTVRAGIARTFAGSQTTLGISAYRQFRTFTLAFAGNASLPAHAYDVQLRLGLSFGRNPLTGRLFTARPGLAAQGAIAMRAYEDRNGNRAYDPGERLLPAVEFGTGTQSGKTDANGTVFIGGLGDGVRTSVRIDPDTLPDIAFAPVVPGIEVVPRAGRIHVSDFAIVALSEIEATAQFVAAGKPARGVSGLVLLLRDAKDGRQVARVRSEADGYVLFEQVRPGTYRIALDPGQAQSLHLALDPAEPLVIGPDGKPLHARITVRETAGP